MDFLKNTNMGAPLGRQAFECLREEKRTLKPHHPPPPQSAPVNGDGNGWVDNMYSS